MTRFVLVLGSAEDFESAVDEVGRGAERHVVRDTETAARAVMAAVAGRSLVVHGLADQPVIDRLLDDLRRLDRVEVWAPPPAAALNADERKLLELLATGRTLREAAAELYLSPRTADRRLARARQALGVRTTAEAILALRRRP